jgi:hypothetical protein
VSEVRPATTAEEQILRAWEDAKDPSASLSDSAIAFAAFCKGWGAGYKLGSEDACNTIESSLAKALGSKP